MATESEEPSSVDDQLSEYDSDSSQNEDSSTNEEDAVDGVPVNFLSRTVRMCTREDPSRSHIELFHRTEV